MIDSTTASAIGTLKIAWYLSAFALFEYLNIPQAQLGILAILMIVDFASGVGKQYRLDKSKITSHDGWLGAIKKVATLCAILTIALVFKGLEMDAGAYIKGALSIIIMAEGYSIIQNIYAIRTGNILPEFDVVSILLKSFSDFLKKRIETAVSGEKVETK